MLYPRGIYALPHAFLKELSPCYWRIWYAKVLIFAVTCAELLVGMTGRACRILTPAAGSEP